MSVSKADVMLLEARLRGFAPRMGVKLICHSGLHNDPYENPVQVTWGSNSFRLDRDDLAPLLDLIDPIERINPSTFLNDYWEPFIRRYAG